MYLSDPIQICTYTFFLLKVSIARSMRVNFSSNSFLCSFIFKLLTAMGNRSSWSLVAFLAYSKSTSVARRSSSGISLVPGGSFEFSSSITFYFCASSRC